MSSPPNEAAAPRGKSTQRGISDADRLAGAVRDSASRDSQWFERFMANLPGLAWIKDAGGRYVYVNAAAEAAFGKTLAALRGKTDAEVFPKETAEHFSANDRAALEGGAGIQTVETLMHPDGVLHYSIVSKFPIPGPDGRARFVGGVAIDITERKRAEAAVHERDERIRLVQAAGHIGSIDLDVKTGRIYRSPEYLALQGLPADAPLEGTYSDQWLDRVHPEDREKVALWFREDLARGGTFDREYRIIRPDTGETRWLHNRGRVDLDAAGKPVRLLSAQTDITGRKAAEAALRETEARFREAANSAPAPVWMTNSEGKIEFVNQALEEFAGMPAPSLLGDVWLSMIHPDDLPGVVEARAKAWANGHAAYAFETRFRRHDGEWRWLEVSSKPRRDSAGDFHGYVGLAVDRTDARRAEAVLRESEERFRLMSESAPVMIWMSDVNGRCLHLNRMQREFWNVEDSALADFDWGMTLHPDDAGRVGRAVREALATQRGLSVQGRFRNAAGEYRILQTEAQPRFSVNGEFLGLIGVNVDVTDALRTQEALRESEARYRAVVESQAEMVCRFSHNGTILFVNGAYARARGAEPADLAGQNFWSFVAEEDRAAVRDTLGRLTPAAPEIRIENRFETAEGVRWTLWTNRALSFDAAGRWLEAQSTGIDITERRQAEEHKRLLLDELNHRVKNTLMTVQAIANLSLSGDYSPAELRESFTSRLLALSRVHNLLTDESWMGANLQTVLSQALTPYGYTPDGGGRIRLRGPRVSLSAKEAQTFAMAFHELATNAGKYGALAGPEGTVEIVWSRDAGTPATFALTWTESGGPKVAPPLRRGFGTMMITQILAAQIGGEVSIDYLPQGLVCRMRGSL